MARLRTLSRSKLVEDVRQALRCWDKTGDSPNPLEYLYLFRATRRTEDKSSDQATNEILHATLKVLEAKYGALEADLLRLRFQDLATIYEVGAQLNIAESTVHKKQRQAIEHLAAILYEQEHQARTGYLGKLEQKLALPAQTPLIGVEQPLNEVWELLTSPDSAWLVTIVGLGGIGKTALANELIRNIALTPHFYEVAWVSAKQQEFWPDVGLREIQQPALDAETLIDALLEQLADKAARTAPPPQKLAIVSELLKQQPYLVVIDNLETAADYETLLPLLLKLANPTKFLLTSRYRAPYPGVLHFELKPLNQTDTLAFLKHEAKVRRLTALTNASPAQLESIYKVIGGNPLALKLVVGQLHTLPLPRVLDNLQQARTQTVDELYTYIYWQAWQTLDAAARQVLVTMPLAQNGTLDDLVRESELAGADLDQALQRLINLSLVEVSSANIAQHRYRIHHLTETFLLNEIIKWQGPL
jgi:hypothetical protein